jgi:hypothetical protein
LTLLVLVQARGHQPLLSRDLALIQSVCSPRRGHDSAQTRPDERRAGQQSSCKKVWGRDIKSTERLVRGCRSLSASSEHTAANPPKQRGATETMRLKKWRSAATGLPVMSRLRSDGRDARRGISCARRHPILMTTTTHGKVFTIGKERSGGTTEACRAQIKLDSPEPTRPHCGSNQARAARRGMRWRTRR